ncbi:Oidioi.mRNA.OKI2018_I69.PAR.g12540.t1.cds [Oikopleura dioica]|uniref:Oidioi.mRNA.OKI2018_I69.PAR.g12540.t1.cds n=1 Tax=Oikopleura dioica TaxID=34765 RepID=A0ABN7S3X3_OIKDI|nr:Oidioi.mRNA.OKI2018_I69.PAR.g12540.t1.cds [Oikopleura dioica]
MTKDAQYTINYENPSLPTYAAKEYFDDLLGERFENDWKSVRCALLSPAKKCAFVTDPNEQLIETLESIGAQNIMGTFSSRAETVLQKEQENLLELKTEGPGEGMTEAEHYNKLIRTRLLVEQMESSIEASRQLVIYATPLGNFNQLPRPLAINNGLKDFIKTDLADVFVALAHAPRASENCLLLNSEAEIVPLLLRAAPYCMFCLNNGEYNAARNVIASVKEYLDPDNTEERIHAKSDKTLKYGENLADDISEHYIREGVFSSILLDAESTNDRVSMNENSSLNLFHPSHTHIRQSLPISQKNQLKKEGIRISNCNSLK